MSPLGKCTDSYSGGDETRGSVFSAARSYAYDAFNRRVVEDGRQLVYNTNWQVLEERDAATGQVLVRNVWSPVYIDAMILRDRDANGVAGDAGGPADNAGLEERVYLLQDANFNVTAATDAAGQVVERYIYDPYGTRTVLNGTADADGAVAEWSVDNGNTSDITLTQAHQGGRQMAGSYGGVGGGGQAIDFRHRTLLSGVGTWNREDPARYLDGKHFYQVVRSSPLVNRDPLGLQAVPQRSWEPSTTFSGGDPIPTAAAISGMTYGEAMEIRNNAWRDSDRWGKIADDVNSSPFTGKSYECVRFAWRQQRMFHDLADAAQDRMDDHSPPPLDVGHITPPKWEEDVVDTSRTIAFIAFGAAGGLYFAKIGYVAGQWGFPASTATMNELDNLVQDTMPQE